MPPGNRQTPKPTVRSIHLGPNYSGGRTTRDPFKRAAATRTAQVGKAQQKFGKERPMPAKRNLGPEDSGLAQRVGGLKRAGEKYTGSLGKSNTKQTRAAEMTKRSKGGAKSPKR